MLPLQEHPKVRIFAHLIEPNPLLRQLILAKLKTDPRIRVLEQKRVGVLSTTPEQRVTVLIDRSATGSRFRDALHEFVSGHTRCRVAILDNDDLPISEICSLISNGVHGFLSFSQIGKQLIPAIHALDRGELWFPPSVLDYYVRGVNSVLLKRTAGGGIVLTLRQEQIAALVRKGLSNKEIGVALSISENTVKFHLRKIFVKLGVQDRRSLMLQVTSSAVMEESASVQPS